MATVHVPSLLRDLTQGAELVEVALPDGALITVGDLLFRIDAQHPGFSERLLYFGDLMPGIAVFVDGQQGFMKLQEKVGAKSHVHFLPPIVGG
jgi:molybdopterin converting factor small subunit